MEQTKYQWREMDSAPNGPNDVIQIMDNKGAVYPAIFDRTRWLKIMAGGGYHIQHIDSPMFWRPHPEYPASNKGGAMRKLFLKHACTLFISFSMALEVAIIATLLVMASEREKVFFGLCVLLFTVLIFAAELCVNKFMDSKGI